MKASNNFIVPAKYKGCMSETVVSGGVLSEKKGVNKRTDGQTDGRTDKHRNETNQHVLRKFFRQDNKMQQSERFKNYIIGFAWKSRCHKIKFGLFRPIGSDLGLKRFLADCGGTN